MSRSPFKFIGNLNTVELFEALNSNESNWDKYTFRQERFVCFQDTKTIPIIFDEKFSTNEIKLTENFTRFEKPLEYIKSQISKLIGDGQIQSCILVNLPAKKKIAKHIDTFKFARLFRRLHIPIQTNDDCYFFIDKESKNLKVGEIWEIANDEFLHWVENNGPTDRIHLIVDWKEKSPTDK